MFQAAYASGRITLLNIYYAPLNKIKASYIVNLINNLIIDLNVTALLYGLLQTLSSYVVYQFYRLLSNAVMIVPLSVSASIISIY